MKGFKIIQIVGRERLEQNAPCYEVVVYVTTDCEDVDILSADDLNGPYYKEAAYDLLKDNGYDVPESSNDFMMLDNVSFQMDRD